MLKTLFMGISVLFLFSCSTVSTFKVDKQHKLNIGLKIATIADTQLTTDKLENEYLFRTRFADKVSNWAIRTTAQEFLALENLGYFFDDMKKLDPDVILYLGDGMNSGCKDEVNDFFAQLEKSRAALGKPIYFVIGNHDYLATGNQTDHEVRVNTCGTGNGVYNKGELIAKTDKFNSTSYEKYSDHKIFLSFKDNIGTNDKSSGNSNKPWELAIDKACDEYNPEVQHKDKNFKCFYTGILEYMKNGVKGQIVLTDTSDYRDVVIQPDVKITEFYGTVGGISWESGGQGDWIKKNVNGSNDVRIVASHYKVDQLGYTDFYTGRPGDLLLKGKNKNLWLSAHTHLEDPNGGMSDHRYANKLIFNAKKVHQINVGSTTDYLPHFAVVESNFSGTFKRSYPTKADYNELQCESLVEGIKLNSSYLPVLHGSRNTRLLLGLTGEYRDSSYKSKNARSNLNKLLNGLPKSERERYARCLLYIGAKAEKTLR